MDQDSAHMVTASKVPMLKPGKYEIWRMRIEQYIQMIDYALWEVIKNGATFPITKVMEGVMTEMPITIVEEKAKKIREKRFGWNAATKKTQRNLLKQQYENFTAPSLDMLDHTFDRLQKLVSELELLEEKLSQEDFPELNVLSGEDAFNHLFVLDCLQCCGSSESSHWTSVSNSPPEVDCLSSLLPIPSSEGSPSQPT
nr:ribonuclease H-like domain-containing protein [Tanacetum cinerariifolium]